MLKTPVKLLTRRLPLSVHRLLVRRPRLGLFYHVVSDRSLPHVEQLYAYKGSAAFEDDLARLGRRFTLSTFEHPATAPAARTGARPPLALTFDDGFTECFTTVRPLLLKHGAPCSFFLATDFLDNRALHYRGKVSLCLGALERLDEEGGASIAPELAALGGPAAWNRAALRRWLLSLTHLDEQAVDAACAVLGVDVDAFLAEERPHLTREQVRQLRAEGFAVGAHSRSHRRLGSLPPEEIEAEIVESSAIVKELTGADRVAFAFPHTSAGIDAGLLGRIATAHPWIGPFFDGDLARTDDFIVNRVSADESTGAGILTTIRDGYYDYLLSRTP